MMTFIDEHREDYGVEPICAVLPIAPSTYHARKRQQQRPQLRCARAKRDDGLRVEIQRVYDENCRVYGARKVWRQLLREGVSVARCTVARLMRQMGLSGAVRGRRVVTTVAASATGRPLDLVKREFWRISPTSQRG